jgi:small conductance mechanosensitive channel
VTAMNDQLESVQQIKTTLIDVAVRFGPKVLVALLVVALGFLVARWVSRWTDRGLHHVELEPPVRLLLARVAYAAVMVLFLIIALQNLGVELLPLIAGLGVAGAGIALAMQGVLSNLVAGLSIIFTKPYRVGQYISITGEEGVVETITLFSTVLSHPDRSLVVIPNRKIAGEILHNFGRIRQIDVSVGVAYDTDLNAALSAVDQVLKANPRVLADPPAVIGVSRLADSAIEIAVKPWVSVADYRAARAEINKAVVEILRVHDIVIPFPQREVRLLKD